VLDSNLYARVAIGFDTALAALNARPSMDLGLSTNVSIGTRALRSRARVSIGFDRSVGTKLVGDIESRLHARDYRAKNWLGINIGTGLRLGKCRRVSGNNGLKARCHIGRGLPIALLLQGLDTILYRRGVSVEVTAQLCLSVSIELAFCGKVLSFLETCLSKENIQIGFSLFAKSKRLLHPFVDLGFDPPKCIAGMGPIGGDGNSAPQGDRYCNRNRNNWHNV